MSNMTSSNEITNSTTAYIPVSITNERLMSRCNSFSSQFKKFMKAAHHWQDEKNKIEEDYSWRIYSYKMLTEVYCELLEVRDRLEKHQNNDMTLLEEMVTLQSKTIAVLQGKVSEHSSTEQIGSSRYNFRKASASQAVKNDVTVINSARCKEIYERLSTKNVNLKSEVKQLKEKRTLLEQKLRTCLLEIEGSSSSADKPKVMKTILEQKNEDVIGINKLTDVLQNEFKCVICNEILIQAVVTNCNHSFCKYCITKWEKINPSCPICRHPRTLHMNAGVIDSFLNNLMSLITTPVKQNWQRISKEREALQLVANSKKRKLNSDTNNRRQTTTLVVNLDADDSLDDSMDWDEMIASLRNIRNNMGSSSTAGQNTSRRRPASHSDTVVDLTEDEAD